MSTDHPASAVHELRGNVLYTQHGDSPYWAIRKLVQELGGGAKGMQFEIDGETWEVSISNQKSGLEPRVDDRVESLYEYRVNAYGHGQRKLPLLIQPRLNWSEERRPKSVPKGLGLATNVRVETASNVEPEEIEALVPRLFQLIASTAGVSWNLDYFTGQPHQFSTIIQYERYYRIQREMAKKVVRSDGIFHRIFQLLADRAGSKLVYSADNTETIGYNHQLRLDRDAADALIAPGGPQLGKQFKHYHPKYVRKQGKGTDPLYHPKIGALFKKGWNNGTAVPWNNHREVRQELEENLVNLLQWAGVPTRCGPTFIPDDHFGAVSSNVEIALWDDPTPKIEKHQDSVLVSTLTRLRDRDLDVLEAVATDGGADVAELESETGWSTSTIYRALHYLDTLLQNDNGNVSFISEKIAQRVRDVVSVTEEIVDAQARIVEDVLNVDPRVLEREGRAWQNWLHRYGAELVDDDRRDRKRIRIDTLLSELRSTAGEWAPEIVKYGAIAWINAGRDPQTFRNAVIEYKSPSGTVEASARSLLRATR